MKAGMPGVAARGSHGEELRLAAARVRQALAETDAYVTREDFGGYDPYDALSSPIFELPLLRSNHYVRVGAQQVVKRLFVNIRPLLGITKKVSAVSLARMLEGYAQLFAIEPSRRDYFRARIEICLRRIDALRSPSYTEHCWGYEWDWEPHYAEMPIPERSPNIIATGIITNALFETHRLTGTIAPAPS